MSIKQATTEGNKMNTNDTTATASQIVAANQIAGIETAAINLADRPEDLTAIEAAIEAGARWSKIGKDYALAIPGKMETIAIAFVDDFTVDFGSSINDYR